MPRPGGSRTNLFDYNRYMYARGNPMRYTDPTGHQATLPMSPDYWQAVENLMSDSQALGPEGPMLAVAVIGAPITVDKAVQFVLNEPPLNYPSPYPNADIGNGNISVTIPVPGSTTLTTPGVPLTSDNQTSLTGVTASNNPVQQLADPLLSQQKGSNILSLVYEPSPKHNPNVRGNVSPAPTNGQSALDVSIQVGPNSPRRVGVDSSTGEIVVFDQTTSGVFHGHVRTWGQLTQPMQNVLIDAGLANRRGKIQ